MATDPCFPDKSAGESDAESSTSSLHNASSPVLVPSENNDHEQESPENDSDPSESAGMDASGFAGPTVKPLTPEALAAFNAEQERAGIIYISRIPPGMRPSKVRHIMSGYGEVGRVYLQQEDPKRAYLRRKYTSTKKAHFTEGWVEFKDKRVARRIASMLNATPIGGKKGTRWKDDIWTMKYLPKFKWNMLTEQVAHESALHTAKLRMELQQSKSEQREYLKNVELARVLEKRAQKKREQGKELVFKPREPRPAQKRAAEDDGSDEKRKRSRKTGVVGHGEEATAEFQNVLSSVF